MGQASHPQPALLVIGVLSSEESARVQAGQMLARGLGVIQDLGLKTAFTWSGYYAQEMGVDLQRSFFWAESLVERDALAPIKLWTNAIEARLCGEGGGRSVNLDPGLLCLENLQLASTKNNGCRIYLGQGVFAELTLRFEHGAFQVLPWTYPDYGSKIVQEALLPLRRELKQRLQSKAPVFGLGQARTLLQEERL